MLELEVIPEHGLSSDLIEFLLGMHFSHAVSAIQSLVGSIKGVQILYSDKEPLNLDLVINLVLDGIKLIFDPISQRLKIIQVHDLTLLKLKYSDVVFNGPDVAPTIEQIDQTFGATHPGIYDKDKQVFTLTFRGLSFEFHAETQFQPTYGGIKQELGSLRFAPGESPRVSRMYIYSGNALLPDCTAPPMPLPRYPCLHHDSVQVLRRRRQTVGLRVNVMATPPIDDDKSPRQIVCREITFDDSAQDVLSALGAPSRVFFKSEDKMKIHSPHAHRKIATQKSDYFFNYFTLGFDVLFDARTHCVKKFVLHTNYPGHYNFNMYHRCQFDLPLYPETTTSSGHSQCLTPINISPFTRWDEISERIKLSEMPVVLNRASSTNTTNPFGSTFCYGYQDVIFEVMPNSYIASVTLYNASPCCKQTKRLSAEAMPSSTIAPDMNHSVFL